MVGPVELANEIWAFFRGLTMTKIGAGLATFGASSVVSFGRAIETFPGEAKQ